MRGIRSRGAHMSLRRLNFWYFALTLCFRLSTNYSPPLGAAPAFQGRAGSVRHLAAMLQDAAAGVLGQVFLSCLAVQILRLVRPCGRPGLVGLDRIELSTSPLSGVRSSQLSYRPKLVELIGIEPTAS